MNQYKHTINLTGGALLGLTVTSGLILSSPFASADNSAVDNLRINIPISCNLASTQNTAHTATIEAGRYVADIGESTITATCNDAEGFAIYAIGYTGEVHGNNTLKNIAQDSTATIASGTATSGATSNWAMKLTAVEGTYTPTIENGFGSYSSVPETNTKVASHAANTDVGDGATGAKIKSTYAAYIAPTQTAGTYEGKVKYTLVHPSTNPIPNETMLDTGANINVKMKNLSANTTNAGIRTTNTLIKSIQMADSLPENFEATVDNTISTADSRHPVYIFFDNTNNQGIMYVYSGGYQVVMNESSGSMFRMLFGLTDISGLEDWDSSNVTSLSAAFMGCTSLANLHGLERWDVGRLTNMGSMFQADSALSDITALTNWNTSNVTSMASTFVNDSSLTNLSALTYWDTDSVTTMNNMFNTNTSLTSVEWLANWDTSAVTNMSGMFANNTSLISLAGLENWNTSAVTTMNSMFSRDTSLTSAAAIESWNTSNVTDMSQMFYTATSLVSLDLSRWNTSSATNMKAMFAQDTSLTSINVSNWDTRNVTNMGSMFNVGNQNADNSQLTEIIGLSNWNVSNVEDMTCMFYGAGNMTHYDIANWNVGKVQSFNHMFTDNFKLESLDLSGWNVSSVKTMVNMFDDNYALTTIGDVSHWNTASLIDVGGWLNGASSFVGDNGTMDLSGWNTSNLKSAEEMFRATKLETIDLSSWTFDSITNDGWEGAGEGIYYEYGTGLDRMFQTTPLLNTVYLSQSGLDSYNAAVNRGVDITNMWYGSNISSFTVKP